MKKVAISLVFLLSGCLPNQNNAKWAETTGTLTVESKPTEGQYWYTIKYDVPESTAVNLEGKTIRGPIEQSGLLNKKPINGQKIKLRYMRDEPNIFELSDQIKYE